MKLGRIAVVLPVLLIGAPSLSQAKNPALQSTGNDSATLSLTCVNPAITVGFPLHQTFPDGTGKASSAPVQFNVDTPGINGAVFVDHNNRGDCTITIDGDHVLVSGYATIVRSFVYGDYHVPVEKVVRPDHDASNLAKPSANNTIMISMVKTGYPDNNVANVQVQFSVSYRKSVPGS